MILIFSEDVDLSTRNVLRYLYYFKENFEIFNEFDLVELTYNISSTGTQYTVFKNGIEICKDYEIKSVWYRRTDIRVKNLGELKTLRLREYAYRHIQTRYENIRNSFHKKKCLGFFGKGNINKLEFLQLCQELNIDIPKTLITNSKKELSAFYKECNNAIITKSLGLMYEYQFIDEGQPLKWKLGYTHLISEEELSTFEEIFDLSLFQEKLEKKFEIRVFYLDGICFSQAIFSQMNSKSNLDYRQGYDTNMRSCNFIIPFKVELQVRTIMEQLGLNTGSMDIVVTQDNKYVFLEVNPSGQFGAVSEITNHNIEFEIAKYLSN